MIFYGYVSLPEGKVSIHFCLSCLFEVNTTICVFYWQEHQEQYFLLISTLKNLRFLVVICGVAELKGVGFDSKRTYSSQKYDQSYPPGVPEKTGHPTKKREASIFFSPNVVSFSG